MGYTFDNLSDMEFSELCRDLLAKREGLELFLSPEGRDGGIDIWRAGLGDTPDLVVQCKHYVKSPKSVLLAKLKAELRKVHVINPKRYVIVASQSLTLANKAMLKRHFASYIKTPDDILGAEDINDLLAQHQEVEHKHYKLWLPSSAVLRELLAKGTGVWRSQIDAEIEDRSRLYVQTPAFQKALSVLEKNRIVVIAGAPGIGKTTLAQMLAAHHLNNGYLFHEIESLDVEPKHIPRESPVFIYFDDFLGRSVWRDNASPQTEKRLERLIDLVERDSRLRLVLTTRAYLLDSARKFSDVGDRKLIPQPQVFVELADYSRTIRAKILYNHLFFQGARASSCRSLTDMVVLNKILGHCNFAPRIIEWVTKEEKSLNLESISFADYILASLDNPEKLYKSVIQGRISENARDILYCLISQRTRHEVPISRLKRVVNCLRHCESKAPLDGGEMSGLRELDGSLVNLRKGFYFKDEEGVTFLNPGVEDSVKASLWESDTKWLSMVDAADFGEDLYAIMLCVKGISSNPYLGKSAPVPDRWFERWLELASLRQGSADELLEAFVRCLSFNIWHNNFQLIHALIIKLRARHDEGFDFWPNWSIFGTAALPDGAVEVLESIQDFQSDFNESVSDELRNLGLIEAGDRFSNLKRLGSLGMRSYIKLEEVALDQCNELWGEAWEEADQLFMKESSYDELTKIISAFDLESQFPELETVTVLRGERPKPKVVRVAEPPNAEPEEPDIILSARFESLARLFEEDQL